MYTPNYASITNLDLIKSFIKKHSFGTLISNSGKNANHYPFLLTEENDKIVLWAHMARSNPQWQELEANECLVIFTGPHAYMSPTFYINELNVPTWNYTAVHANCKAEVISDSSIEKELMVKLVKLHEEKNQTNWKYELPDDFHHKLLKAIVWIKLEVTNLQAKFKLSQNREHQDYQKILKCLKERASNNDQELLHYMELANPFK